MTTTSHLTAADLQLATPEVQAAARERFIYQLRSRGSYPSQQDDILIKTRHEGPDFAPNLQLLLDVLVWARAEEQRPREQRRFDMGTWFSVYEPSDDRLVVDPSDHFDVALTPADAGQEPLVCGTTACLAGTAVAFTLEPGQLLTQDGLVDAATGRLVADETNGWDWAEEGAARLGLTHIQGDYLFTATGENVEGLALIATYMTGYDFTVLV